jgi:hypothetical protein
MARQAGTASAFAPLVPYLAAALPARPNVVFAYPPAAAVFSTSGVQHQPIERFDDARGSLESGVPALLLTGTSLHADDDSRWWEWARSQRTPCVAFVDQWCNYAERFTVGGRLLGGAHWPDAIAALDELVASRLVEAGVPQERVIVTGTPLLDGCSKPADAAIRAARREILPTQRDALLILYVCEPDPAFRGQPHRLEDARFFEVFAHLANAARTAARTLARPVHIAVKPHPIQHQHGFRHSLPRLADETISASLIDMDAVLLAWSSDLVVGRQSMLLHQAAAIGKPVISLQERDAPLPDMLRATPGVRVASPEALSDAVLDGLRAMPRAVQQGAAAGSQVFVAALRASGYLP